MDILKLLSRSTNLQKTSPANKKASNKNIPSTGHSTHPQSYHGEISSSAETFPSEPPSETMRGVKRKRGGENVETQIDLDFFSDSVETLHRARSRQSATGVGTIRENGPASRSPTETIDRLSAEECRRIFKSHKLKVTLLGRSDQEATKDQKRHKKRTAATRPNKMTPVQLLPQPLMSFTELRAKFGISRRLAENLDRQGYSLPTEVQLGSLPLLLGSDEERGLRASRKSKQDQRSGVDLLTIAPTGSGKTLAFLIPIVHGLLKDRHIRKGKSSEKSPGHELGAVVIAPTHELVDQLVNEGKKLAIGTGIKVAGMSKGMNLYHNREDSETFPGSQTFSQADLLVATPLNLVHAISSTTDGTPGDLSSVQYLVLDEADVLLDPMFRQQTLAIWEACTSDILQTSMWSATIGSSIEALAQSFISERRRKLNLSSSNHHMIRLVVGLKDSALPTISHRLVYAATEQGKLLALRQLLHPSAADSTAALRPPFLVFTQTIARAIALHSELLYDISPEAGGSARIAVLHSDLSDTARSNIMAGFRKGEIWILITTDLLSRGVDFRGVNGVVNYDIPNTGAAYVHRAGRTGRAGREGGIAVTFYTKEDIPYVKNIANVIAASEKVKGKSERQESEGVQKWLLDALPTVSKKTRQELKKKGVESRRAVKSSEDGGKGRKRMRISTKSGFERRLETKKKGAMEGSRRRMALDIVEDVDSDSDDEWVGFGD